MARMAKHGVLIRPTKAYLDRHRGPFLCHRCGVRRLGVAALYARGPVYLMAGATVVPICTVCRYQLRRRKSITKLAVVTRGRAWT